MKVLALVALTACNSTVGTFVQSATLDHHDLLITTCTLSTQKDTITASGCSTRRERLPVIVVPAETAPAESPGLEVSEVAEGIAPARPALEQCVRDDKETLSVDLWITVAPTGKVTEVKSSVDRLADCLSTGLADARFTKTRQGARFKLRVAP